MKKLLFITLLLASCEKPQPQTIKEENHEHKQGQFGGFIINIGRDNYHAEVVFHNQILTLYMLDKDETKILEVEKQIIKGYIGGDEFEMMPNPQPGDKPGFTSKFQGMIPKKELNIYFHIKIKEDRFRVFFTLPNSEELIPGGKYTKEDIIANGNVTIAEKFKGFTSNHNFEPKKGDRICPVTFTLANPKCTWIINGKEYWFCCPPCISEFIKLAKEKEIKEPGDYIK